MSAGPTVPGGESAAFWAYRWYFEQEPSAVEEAREWLVAFEWGALAARDPGATRRAAEELIRANLREAAQLGTNWYLGTRAARERDLNEKLAEGSDGETSV
jgi:hypothetical protein